MSCCPKWPSMRGISTEILLLSSIEVEGKWGFDWVDGDCGGSIL